MYQTPQQGPQEPMYEHPPMYGQSPYSKAKNFAVLALIFLIIGGILHILGLIPFLGIIFGCLGLFADLTGIIFLILVITSL